MVGGQVVDLETTGGPVDAVTLEYIHAAKTGSFIRAAVRAGALTAGASDEDLGRVTTYGEKVVDVFFVKNMYGLKVESERKLLGPISDEEPRERFRIKTGSSRSGRDRLAEGSPELFPAKGLRWIDPDGAAGG